MARIVAYIFAFYGAATLALVVVRFFLPKTIPPKSDQATFSIFGGKLSAPAAGVLGSCWLVVAFILFMFADSRDLDIQLAAASDELEQRGSVIDSLNGAISELEIRLAAAPVDSGSIFFKNLRFELDSPVPQLGAGVTAGLRATKESSVDLLVLRGIVGLSFDLESEFENVAEEVSVDYRTRGRFYVKIGNGEVWGINYLGLNKSTQLNQFQFFRPHKF